MNLVCQIFTIVANISDEIFSRNKSWILVFFARILAVTFAGILTEFRF
jgi:hypothetical protein